LYYEYVYVNGSGKTVVPLVTTSNDDTYDNTTTTAAALAGALVVAGFIGFYSFRKREVKTTDVDGVGGASGDVCEETLEGSSTGTRMPQQQGDGEGRRSLSEAALTIEEGEGEGDHFEGSSSFPQL